MSTTPEINLDLDLHFLPAWAQESSAVNRYSRYAGDSEDRGGRFEGRGPRRDGPGGGGRRPDRPPRRDGGGPSRPAGSGGAPGGAAGPRRGPGPDRGFGGPRGQRSDGPRDRGNRPTPPPLPELNVDLVPEDGGVDSLARQIRLTGRAYPIFEVAHLILKKPERYHIRFDVIRKPTGEPVQGLWGCNLDDSLWLSESDAVRHVLTKHFETFYQTEKIAADAPKGTYTFVAQCGMSGLVLGPPNYHDYQNKLHKLHTERFSRIPFEVFKSRVKIVRDEAVVKQWVEEQSWKYEYNCLNVPEPKKLGSREEVERHFREVHLPNIIKSLDSFTVVSLQARETLPGPLQALARRTLDEQRRFPIRVVHILSQQFSKRGLQFFKVNKSLTHVSVARPHFLDMEATPVSEGVRKIVEFINTHPKCNRKQLVETLVPTVASEISAQVQVEGAVAAEAPVPVPSNPLQDSVVRDLHWLVHQGHVLEFANGELDTAKRPAPKPPKPEPVAKPESAAPAAPSGAVVSESQVASSVPEVASQSSPSSEASAPAPSGESPAQGA